MKNPAIKQCLRKLIGMHFTKAQIIVRNGGYYWAWCERRETLISHRAARTIIALLDANGKVLEAREACS